MNNDEFNFLKEEIEVIKSEVRDLDKLLKIMIIQNISQDVENINSIDGNILEAGKLYIEALDLHKEQKYVESYRLFKLSSEIGNAEALFKLGDFYYYGLGSITRDVNKGIDTYKKAIAKIPSDDIFALGDEYHNLSFKNIDDRSAILWELEACRGNSITQKIMADYYSDKEMHIEAIKWYEKLSVSGNADAQFKLAEYYFSGTNIDINHEKALELYKQASDSGHKEAIQKLEKINKIDK